MRGRLATPLFAIMPCLGRAADIGISIRTDAVSAAAVFRCHVLHR
ncbi:hypothetical protein RSPO_c01740 [Ralstonia solanacearum Po82]|uniref:Uncharacterized protein n=1 Tax=Ralstonia solanacearum (strain Po82) TaxID=1031711 RepID=F6G1H0_RALS8|nr:hypothetical protein RSPO_c01740 [Ralstonia solanacearum Po82]